MRSRAISRDLVRISGDFRALGGQMSGITTEIAAWASKIRDGKGVVDVIECAGGNGVRLSSDLA